MTTKTEAATTSPAFDAYEQLPGLRWSALKYMATSPRLYQLRTREAEPDTPSYLLGRVIHDAALIGDAWESRYVLQPDFGDLRTKAAKTARDAWLDEQEEGVTVLRSEDFEVVRACVESLLSHPVAAKLLDTPRTEVSAQWSFDGVACKGRIDAVHPMHLVDLKTSRQPTLDLITRSLTRYAYHGQLAWYHDGSIRAGVLPDDATRPWLVVVQTVEPYDVVAYECSGGRLNSGRTLYKRLLSDLRSCMATDQWPGMAPDPVAWDVSSWELANEPQPQSTGGAWYD